MKKFSFRGNINCIAMKKFISLLIISQAFSMMANLITKSSTDGKHRNLRIYCTWYSLSVKNKKMNCIWFTLDIPYYLFRPIENNELFEVMVNCGIGHLYPQFRNHSITLDNLWHVTQNMLEMMKIPLNDQITYEKTKKESANCSAEGNKCIILFDHSQNKVI